MINRTPRSPGADDELAIDLADLASYLWARKSKLFISAAIGGMLMLVVALSMRNVYESRVLLAPAQDDSAGLASLAGQFGGLASLTGINLGNSDQMTAEGMALFTARDFLLDYIHEKKIKPVLFYKDWDQKNKCWKEPGFPVKAFNGLRKLMGGREGLSRNGDPNEPTDWDAYDLFTDNFISVKQDRKTSLVTVSVRAYSPKDAQQWARDLVARANNRLRMVKKVEAEKSIAYLQKASQETSAVEMRKAMYDLIEAQAKTIMLANAKEEFAFKTLDPAFFSEQKVKPRRGLMLLGGVLMGALIACAVLVVSFVRRGAH